MKNPGESRIIFFKYIFDCYALNQNGIFLMVDNDTKLIINLFLEGWTFKQLFILTWRRIQ